MTIESPNTLDPPPLAPAAHMNAGHVSTAVVAAIFAVSGPTAIMLTVGTNGGMSEAEMASWIFGAFFLNGAISLAVSLIYRQPLVFLWTIPGVVLIGPALEHLTFAEVVGAYYATGALMIVLGFTGWVRRAMEALPLPIVMAMVAGVFLQFGLDWILAFTEAFWIAAPMTATFFAVAAWPALAARCPPLIAAVIVGIIAVWVLGEGAGAARASFTIAEPIVFAPAFSWAAMFELVVPLAVTVIAVQNGQGIAVMRSVGHKPPVNAITVVCGAGSMITATVGTVPTCLTGPLTGILTTSRPKIGHYGAAALASVLVIFFGLFAPFFTAIMLATPKAFIATLAGIALVKVLQGAFVAAFKGEHTLGALIAFLITVSDIAILNIGAPFWGLVFGFAASKLMDRGSNG